MPLDPAIVSDYQSFRESVKDPALSVAYFLSKISDEKSSTNLLVRDINAKLDKIAMLETRVAKLESMLAAANLQGQNPKEAPMAIVAEVDEQILAFVKSAGKCIAQDVADKFGYKGKNAACARLNRLATAGLLSKRQAGRKVYYLPAEESRKS